MISRTNLSMSPRKKHVFTDDLSAMDVDCRALENEYITASESEIPDPKHCFGEFTALSSSNNAVPVISGNTINLVTGQISATLTTSIDADYNGSPEIKTTITDGVGAAISDLHTISVEAKNDTPNIEIRKNGTPIAHNSTITIDEGEDYSLTLVHSDVDCDSDLNEAGTSSHCDGKFLEAISPISGLDNTLSLARFSQSSSESLLNLDFDPEFHGTKTITLSVDDEISADSINHHETGVASKTVTMKVTNINDSPEITAIDKLITTEKVEKIFQIHFTDKDNNFPSKCGFIRNRYPQS